MYSGGNRRRYKCVGSWHVLGPRWSSWLLALTAWPWLGIWGVNQKMGHCPVSPSVSLCLFKLKDSFKIESNLKKKWIKRDFGAKYFEIPCSCFHNTHFPWPFGKSLHVYLLIFSYRNSRRTHGNYINNSSCGRQEHLFLKTFEGLAW